MGMLSTRRFGIAGFVVVFAALIGSVTSVCETCSSPWFKYYESDSQGNPVMGDRLFLESHIYLGNFARYVIPTWGSGYAAPLGEFAEIYMGNEVQLCGHSLRHLVKARWDAFPDEAAWRFLVVCTSGKYQEILYDMSMKNQIRVNKGVVGIQWFVKTSPCVIPAYGNDASGNDALGIKAHLVDAVLRAYDIRVSTITTPITLIALLNNVEVSRNEITAGQSVWQMATTYVQDHYELTVPVTWRFTMYSTSAKLDTSSWMFGKHTLVSRNTRNEQMVWYIDPCWQHVYTNDENGEVKEGSLEFLVAAVEAGHRVKVLVGNYSIEPDSVRSARGRLSAQLLDQVSKKDLQTFNDDAFWVWQMIHSSGAVRTRTYFVGSNVNNGNRVERISIRWFIDTRTWTKVLSTNPNGEVEFGSKSELRAAIKKGANVRVAWRVCKRPVVRPTIRHRGHFHGIRGGSSYWYFTYSRFTRSCRGWLVMTADNVELGPNEEVAAQLIRTVSAESVSREQFQITERNPFWRFMTVSTLSNVDVSQWGIGGGLNNGHFSEKAYVRWFVSY